MKKLLLLFLACAGLLNAMEAETPEAAQKELEGRISGLPQDLKNLIAPYAISLDPALKDFLIRTYINSRTPFSIEDDETFSYSYSESSGDLKADVNRDEKSLMPSQVSIDSKLGNNKFWANFDANLNKKHVLFLNEAWNAYQNKEPQVIDLNKPAAVNTRMYTRLPMPLRKLLKEETKLIKITEPTIATKLKNKAKAFLK